MQSQKFNAYFATLVDPFNHTPVPIPDEINTESIVKSTSVSTTYQYATPPAPNAGNAIMFVVPFHSPRRTIQMFAYDSTSGRFNYLQTFYQDEDLALVFRKLRLISGGMQVISSTVSGTSFTISGNVNEIATQDLPPISQLTHETLLSWKRDNFNAVGSVPVATGVAILAPPDWGHEYWVPDYNDQTRATVADGNQLADQGDRSHVLSVDYQVSNQPSIVGAGSQTYEVEAPLLNDMRVEPWGRHKIRVRCDIQADTQIAGPASTTPQIEVQAIGLTADPATFAQVSTVVNDGGTLYGTLPNQIAAEVTLEADYEFDSDIPINNITITVSNTAPNSIHIDNLHVEWDNFDYLCPGVSGPASIVSIKALSNNQQISLAGRYNYEAVPTATLAKNVPTSYTASYDPLALEAAEKALAHPQSSGIRYVYTLQDYYKFQEKVDEMSRAEALIGHAASVGGFFSSLWRALRPTIEQGIGIGSKFLAENTPLAHTPFAPMAKTLGEGLTKFVRGEAATRRGYAATVELLAHEPVRVCVVCTDTFTSAKASSLCPGCDDTILSKTDELIMALATPTVSPNGALVSPTSWEEVTDYSGGTPTDPPPPRGFAASVDGVQKMCIKVRSEAGPSGKGPAPAEAGDGMSTRRLLQGGKFCTVPPVSGPVGFASSKPKTLRELMASKQAKAALPAVQAGGKDAHVLGLTRMSDPLTDQKSEALASGDWARFETSSRERLRGVVATSQLFPVTDEKGEAGGLFTLFISDEPLGSDGKQTFSYKDYGSMAFDLRFSPRESDVEELTRALPPYFRGRKWYFASTFPGEIEGTSWFFAALACAAFVPGKWCWTGHHGDLVVHLTTKFLAAASDNMKLFVLNPLPQEWKALVAEMESEGVTWIENPGFGADHEWQLCVGTVGQSVPNMFALASLGARLSKETVAKIAPGVETTEQARSRAAQIATSNQPSLVVVPLDARGKTQGGGAVEMDMSQINPAEWADEFNLGIEYLASKGQAVSQHKMANYINAKSWRSAANLYAQVANAQAGLLAEKKKKKPAAALAPALKAPAKGRVSALLALRAKVKPAAAPPREEEEEAGE